jgi:fructose-1,6-bisphosphatase
MPGTATLETHVEEAKRRGLPDAAAAALLDVAAGVKGIAAVLARAVVCGAVAPVDGGDEPQRRIAALVNDLLVEACVRGGHVAAVASAELSDPRPAFGRHAAPFLLALDPLDGGSHLCVNATAGTVFSVLPLPPGASPGRAAFLQRGAAQLCAGYAIYGPCTMLVLTTGDGVAAFTLDPAAGRFVLTHPDLRIPEEARELAVDAFDARHWARPVRRYVDECVAGDGGPRRADFEMRWVGSIVADVHRVLVRGGAALYPVGEGAARPPRLQLVFDASPAALLVEQAGGAASTGRGRLLDVVPRDLHERSPAILGSRPEVQRLVSYHSDAEAGLDRPYRSPLFNVRSLLRES